MGRLAVSLACAALAALAACGDANKQENVGHTATGTAAAPDAKPGLALTEGVLVLPAVKGRPGAAYFTLANGSEKAVSLAAASVEGAGKTELHETKGGKMGALGPVDIAPGGSVRFERGGKHAMVFDLPEGLVAGGNVEMTVTFTDGDKLSAPLHIQSAGGDGMEGMKH